MKVLQVTGNYPIPPEGGLEVAVVSLSRELANLGVQVRLVGASDRDQLSDIDGVRVRGLPAAKLSNWIRFPSLDSLRTLREEISWADVVHIHNPQELFNLVAAALVLRDQKPLCLSLLSPGALRRHPSCPYRALGFFDDEVVAFLTKRASFVHVKNTHDLKVAAPFNPSTMLIPDGVPDDILDAPRSDGTFRTRLGLDNAYPVLLYVGRLHPLKGPDQLIRATAELEGRFGKAVAVLAGPDPLGMRSGLIDLARELGMEDHVKVVGSLSEPDKIRAIDASNVVVVPSLADFVEGFSIIASEAWARGKPVVGYPVGALKVRIVDGKNGALARSISVRDLADAVTRAMALGPILAVPDVVSWNEVARRVLEAYSRFCRHASPAPL